MDIVLSLLLLLCITNRVESIKGNCNFVTRPADTRVFVGDSTYLNCSISCSASTEVFWYHSPVSEEASTTRCVYSSGKILDPYRGRFKIEKDVSKGAFNLVVRKTELSDAGFYVCQIGQIGGRAESTIAQLTVLESNPVCETNILSTGRIGETSHDPKSDTIRLSCSITFRGNVTPKLRWTQVNSYTSIPVKVSLLTCSSSDFSVNCNYSTEAENVIDGSYFICYVNPSKSVHRECRTDIIKIQRNSIVSTFIVRPVDTEVLVGDSTYLNCSISGGASAEVFWYHYPVGEEASTARSVYSGGKILNPYGKRFTIKKGTVKGTFDLVIKRTRLSDAGFYVCQIGGTTKWTIVQLTVLESGPLWLTNIGSRGFIGRNSCGLKSDTIRLSCGISYRGNVTPKLHVTLVQNGKSIAVKESLLTCSSSDVSVKCNYSSKAENVIDGSYFICYVNKSGNIHRKQRTDIIKILNATNRKLPVLKTVDDSVDCPVHGNTEDRCTFKWLWLRDGNEEMIFTDRTLTITEDGQYRCIATCYINDNECSIDAILIETTLVSWSLWAWLFGIMLCIALLCGLLYYICSSGAPRPYELTTVEVEFVDTTAQVTDLDWEITVRHILEQLSIETNASQQGPL